MKHCLLILLLVISSAHSNILELQDDSDNQENRISRSVAKQSQITEMASRHIKLGRVLNALYLQNQLTTQKIDFYDVITGIWNLKDRTVIEKLVSLNIDGLSALLTTLDTAIKGVPDDVKDVIDVKTIGEKLTSVREIAKETRQKLVTAGRKEAIPEFLGRSVVLAKLNLKENQPQKALDLLKSITDLDQATFDPTSFTPLFGVLFEINSAVSHLPDRLNGINPDRTLTSLVDGLRMALVAQVKKPDLQQLSNQFVAVQGKVSKLKSLDTASEVSAVSQKANTLYTTLQFIHQSPTNISLTSAFTSNQIMSKVYDDLKDEWVTRVLREGKSLKELNGYVEKIKKLSDDFSATDTLYGQLTNAEHILSLYSIFDVIEIIERLQEYMKNPDSFPNTNCFLIPDAPEEMLSLADYEQLSSDVDVLLATVPTIQTALSKMPNKQEMETKIGIYQIYMVNNIKTFKQMQEWTASTEYTEFEAFLTSLVAPFETLKQNATFDESVGRLTEKQSKLSILQKWISGFHLAGESCDNLFNFNTDRLSKLNDIPTTITSIKSIKPFDKLKPLLDTIPKVKTGLLKLKAPEKTPQKSPQEPKPKPKPKATTVKPKTPPNKPKRSTPPNDSLSLSNPDNLLQIAFATRAFQQMEEISRFSEHISNFIARYPRIKGLIESWPDSKTKTEVKKVWDGYDVMEKTLQDVLAKIKEAFAKIQVSAPEKSFEEIGKVYKTLASVPMSQKVRIREFRETMPVFIQKDVQFSVYMAKLIESLEFLEKTAEMDWGMAHASFTKVPKALAELEKDLVKFFGADSDGKGKKQGQSFGEMVKNNLALSCSLGAFILLVIIGGIITLVLYCIFIHDPEMKQLLPKGDLYMPSDYVQANDYEWMQFQDSRLELNRRNPKTKNTRLYDAVVARDDALVSKLVSAGAILDATNNGTLHRTAIFEFVLQKDGPWCQTFLNFGADPEIHDSRSEDADTWADAFGFMRMFETAYHKTKTKRAERHLPYEPRPWNILVFDPKQFPRKLRKKLPLRFKKNALWGHKKLQKLKLELDNFTHIVVPNQWVTEEDTLILDDDNLMTFRALGCKAILITMDWLLKMANATTQEKKKVYMEEDYKYWLLNTFYAKNKNLHSIVQLKTGIHRMTPKLLEGISITLLETKDPKALAQQKDWRDIIKIFGGKVADKIVPDSSTTVVPWHAAALAYRDQYNLQQRACWILAYPDSKIEEEYVDWETCCCTEFRLLPECLARYYLLPLTNDVVKIFDSVNRTTKPTETQNSLTAYGYAWSTTEIREHKESRQTEFEYPKLFPPPKLVRSVIGKVPPKPSSVSTEKVATPKEASSTGTQKSTEVSITGTQKTKETSITGTQKSTV